jgi:hypothetical protein
MQVVVEEYFVPSLNTMCVKYKIPDDVAGATFMVGCRLLFSSCEILNFQFRIFFKLYYYYYYYVLF